MSGTSNRFQLVDSTGRQLLVHVNPVPNVVDGGGSVGSATSSARNIFIRYQPSTSRSVVTIYKRLDVQQPQPTTVIVDSEAGNETAALQTSADPTGNEAGNTTCEQLNRQIDDARSNVRKVTPSSFPHSCPQCNTRFRSALSLLKHLNKVHHHHHHHHRSAGSSSGKSIRQAAGVVAASSSSGGSVRCSNAHLRHLRSLAPSGRILFTLLSTQTTSQHRLLAGCSLDELNGRKQQSVQANNPTAGDDDGAGSGGKASYRCRFCPNTFAFRSLLYQHYKFHRRLSMALSDRKLYCCICTRIFVNRSSLFVHLRSRHPVHTGLCLDLDSTFPMSCSVCMKRFRDETELESHNKQAHYENRPYSCEHCQPVKGFRSLQELEIHQNSHATKESKKKNYACPHCDRQLSTKSNLTRHLILIHGSNEDKARLAEKGKFSKQTGLPFGGGQESTADIQGHGNHDAGQESQQQQEPSASSPRRKITYEDFTKCQLCCRRFADAKALTEHQKLRHSSDDPSSPWPYECSQCGVRFQFPSQLVHHEKTAKNHASRFAARSRQNNAVNVAEDSAAGDGRHFANVGVIRGPGSRHLPWTSHLLSQDVHEEEESHLHRHHQEAIVSLTYEPSLTNPARSYEHQATTNSDLIRNTGNVVSDEWMVPIAMSESINFADSQALDDHQDIELPLPSLSHQQPQEDEDEAATVGTCIEQPNGSFVCCSCSKVFGRLADANRHVRIIHSSHRPYVCEVCGKTFKWRHSLVDHSRTHKGERPYVCDICQACFTASGNLVRHKKHSHSGKT